tara:strand:- start:75 stop:356 length:282 start_codon:yes stop_codon:yes gene_type:complete
MDFEAIYKAYAGVVMVIDETEGAFDGENNPVILDQAKIDAARVELNKLKYKKEREDAYPLIKDQLDMLYWDKKNGTTTWVEAIDKVKSDYPKP